MKNHYDLHHLQQQHAAELQYCQRLRDAINRQAAPSVLKEHALDFWNQRLEHDIREEESKLFPVLTDIDLSGRYLNLVKLDHELIKRTIEHIELDGHFVRIYNLLTELVTQHILFEEQIIFPKLQSHMSLQYIN